MAVKRIKGKLSTKGIDGIIDELKKYRDSLDGKCEELVKRLADEGIIAAQQNVGHFGKYLMFTVKNESDEGSYKAIVVASNSSKIISQWKTKEGIKTAEVSPILLAEWGSGVKARPPETLEDGTRVGQGTFPGQTHAFDKEGWYWQDLNDQWHHSSGVEPSMPVYNAYLRIKNKIESVAKEVFRE